MGVEFVVFRTMKHWLVNAKRNAVETRLYLAGACFTYQTKVPLVFEYLCSFCSCCMRVSRHTVNCVQWVYSYQYQTGIHSLIRSSFILQLVRRSEITYESHTKHTHTHTHTYTHTPSYCLIWFHKKAVSPIDTEVSVVFLWIFELVALLNSCMRFIIAVPRRTNGWIAVGQDCLFSSPLLGHPLRYRGYSSTTDMCLPSPNFRHKVRFSSL